MIKFGVRPNLRYPIQLLIWSFIRNVENEIIGKSFNIRSGLIYMSLMFLGEFLFGLILVLYKRIYINKRKKEITKAFGIKLIVNQDTEIRIKDKWCKIYFLIFLSAFYDFMEFILSIESGSKFITCSYSLETRLKGILIISDALFYYYILRLQIFRHQIFSLIIISIGLILVISTEFIFQDISLVLSYGEFVIYFIIIFLIELFNSQLDLIEKYLFEYDYVNPFIALFYEGIFGLIFSIIYCLYKSPFPVLEPDENADNNYPILISLFFIYVILSGLKNGFRVVTNKIYSPMTATLEQYFLNPIYITYYFLTCDDFLSNGKMNYLYYFLNLFFSIFISLSGCVYTEFLILFFYGLEHDTHNQVTRRASSVLELGECEVEEDE